ncbi:MAG: TonB-dependent receptor [Acidobacteriota bacterium]
MRHPSAQRCRYLFSLLLVLLCCSQVAAQSAGATTAALTGTVKDTSGAIIPAANVQIKSIETGLVRETRNGEGGNFLLSLLPPGEYELKVEAEGFSPQVRHVTLTLGQTLTLVVELQPGSTEEIIEVTSAPPVLEANKTEVSTTIDRQRIESLPINRRNFLDFSLTTPGVNIDVLPSQGPAAASGLSFNGQTPRQNNITIDGLDNNDPGASSVRSTFSQDAVQEFQVISNSFSAEFGRALGGCINIVTRSGTNQLHGTAFLFNRNDNLNARDAFARTNPPFSQYQYGFTLGGPIVKDRHFFFGSYERISVEATNFVTISDLAIGALRRQGFSAENGDIPFEQFNNSLLLSTRHQLSARDTLSLRYNFSRGVDENLDPWGGLRARSNGGVGILRDDAFAISNTAIISPRLFTETRFLFARRSQLVDTLDPQHGPTLTILADEGTLDVGRTTLLPQPRLEHIYQFFSSFSFTPNRQSIKAGVDLYFPRALKKNTALAVIYGGLVVFVPIDFAKETGIPGLPALSALQNLDPSLRTPIQKSFLSLIFGTIPGLGPVGELPLPGAFIQGFGDPFDDLNINYISAFLQDDIKVKSNFTVKLGVRFDREGLDDPFPSSSGSHLSPRIAFAYSPGQNNRINIHAAYGIFHGISQLGTIFAARIVDGVRTKTIALTLSDPGSPAGQAINRALISAFAQPGHKFPETGQVPTQLQNALFPVRVFVPDPDFKGSYAHQANFGVDILLNSDTTISATYQLVRGLHVLTSRNINPIVNPALGDPTGRIFPDKGDIFSFEGGGDSYYHGLSLLLTRRFSHRFGGLISYTFSKALDNFVDFQAETEETVDPNNLRNERGFSINDVRNRFIASGIWDLDYTDNILLRDFQLSTIVTLNSGRPFNLLAGVDLNRNGDNPPGDRPAGIARNAGIAPGFANVDVRLTRSLRWQDRYQLNLTLEVFNLFNRVNITELNRIYPPNLDGSFSLPATDGGRFIATPDRFRNAASARQFQLGVRFVF